MRITPFSTFKEMARPGTRVPIVGELVNDLDTPVALYGNFAAEKYSFLLESVEGGEKWGRYSFVGLSPAGVFKSEGKKVEILEKGKKRTMTSEDPLGELKKLLGRYQFVEVPGLPRFTGGAVGLVAYDMVRVFEKLPEKARKVPSVPDLYFIIPEILLIADSFEQTLKVVYDARIDNPSSIKKEYERGVTLIRRTVRTLEKRRRLDEVFSKSAGSQFAKETGYGSKSVCQISSHRGSV